MTENHHLKVIFLYTANQVQAIQTKGEHKEVRVSQMQYYGYRLSIRDVYNPFLNAGRLTQQYIVDTYVKTEANRLNYVRQNQPKLRVEKYSGLMDHLNNEANEAGLIPGKTYILPSSFAGSPRNMLQNYQDAMAIVRKYGKPDLFITMTCNPKWEEIVNNLQHGQTVDARPDLVARVFHLKLKALIDDICKKQVFGGPKAIVYVREFQKRGLPHAHILLILKYLFKYVYKGHDCANVLIQEQGTLNHDEIKTFMDSSIL
ncbi:uncharacterized protein LOC128343664 [Hemicordylus capensis]|uniref:uncharacterized protein LOC128343664 n=1 Tax=Hemicordylus capensis TaxID=884348 RepID=UPI0023034C64|nr:uncharacterized protein LOC128343664 [Hemicordylus capensis]